MSNNNERRQLSAVDVIARVPAETLKLYVPDDGSEKAYMAIGPENAANIVETLQQSGLRQFGELHFGKP